MSDEEPPGLAEKVAIVKRAMAAKYPSLPLQDGWITAATSYILTTSTAPLNTMQLIENVNYQLLHADLRHLVPASTSGASSSSNAQRGGFYAQLKVESAKDAAIQRGRDTVRIADVLEGVLAPTGQGTSGRKNEVFVQIAAITDIGVSAQTLLDVTQARIQAAKTEGGRRLIEEIDQSSAEADANAANPSRARSRSRSASPTKSTGPNADGADGDEEDAYLAAEEDVMKSSVVYPRRMLSLQLEDGICSETVRAIEMERVPDIGLGRTALGCKMVLRDVEIRNGVLMLRRENVTVKGGAVMELEQEWQQNYVAQLREQLGLPPGDNDRGIIRSSGVKRIPSPFKSASPEKRPGAKRLTKKTTQPKSSKNGSTSTKSSIKSDARKAPTPRQTVLQTTSRPSRAEPQEDDFDVDEDEELAMQQALAAFESAPPRRVEAPASAPAQSQSSKAAGKRKAREFSPIDLIEEEEHHASSRKQSKTAAAEAEVVVIDDDDDDFAEFDSGASHQRNPVEKAILVD